MKVADARLVAGDAGGPPGHPVKHAPIIPAQTHTVVIGGMPGWQITLIAVGAALAAAPWP